MAQSAGFYDKKCEKGQAISTKHIAKQKELNKINFVLSGNQEISGL
jgi:hypothetical protein